MPPKINAKAAESRDRKESKKQAKAEEDAKAAEDAKWADDDPDRARKEGRAAEKAAKAESERLRKLELRELAKAEEAALSKASAKPAKVTQAQIATSQAALDKERQKEAEAAALRQKRLTVQPDLEENTNVPFEDEATADTVERALSILSTDDAEAADKHPEKRRKAAFKAYEAKNLPLLKAKYPSLRLAQLKEMVFKDFQKSPDNPMNQK